MILVDTSVWIEHFRSGDERLVPRLEAGEVLTHPFIIGELALGNFRDRSSVLDALANLPQATRAEDGEVLALIDSSRLHGTGIGYVDAHLLASVRLTPMVRLWTRDRRLQLAASHLGLSASA